MYDTFNTNKTAQESRRDGKSETDESPAPSIQLIREGEMPLFSKKTKKSLLQGPTPRGRSRSAALELPVCRWKEPSGQRRTRPDKPGVSPFQAFQLRLKERPNVASSQ
ncbi:hypothetical protein MHYP_G00353270 [Metynnis hypsauchen]